MPRDPLRLLFVIPWRDRGCWIWEHLPDGFVGDLAFAAPEPGAFQDRHRLPPYLAEFVALVFRRVPWNDYNVVFSWELRSALAAATLLRFSGRKRRPKWVAVGPILKGRILRVLPLVRFLLKDADHIVCFSRVECADYARLLRLPRSRFSFLPTPWLATEEETDRNDGYVLALGQSNRDYPTLLEAVRGMDIPVWVVAANTTALGGGAIPPNVRVSYQTGHAETIDIIAGATMHCIPLHDTGYSAGQTVLLRAMARGKAVVVSDTAGIRDYVHDGETAVLVPPGNVVALRAALVRLWNDPAERARLGTRAATTVREECGFEQFTRSIVALAFSLTPQPNRQDRR